MGSVAACLNESPGRQAPPKMPCTTTQKAVPQQIYGPVDWERRTRLEIFFGLANSLSTLPKQVHFSDRGALTQITSRRNALFIRTVWAFKQLDEPLRICKKLARFRPRHRHNYQYLLGFYISRRGALGHHACFSRTHNNRGAGQSSTGL